MFEKGLLDNSQIPELIQDLLVANSFELNTIKELAILYDVLTKTGCDRILIEREDDFQLQFIDNKKLSFAQINLSKHYFALRGGYEATSLFDAIKLMIPYGIQVTFDKVAEVTDDVDFLISCQLSAYSLQNTEYKM
jgi:hypothetical protein